MEGGLTLTKAMMLKTVLLLVVMMLAPPHSLPSNSFSSCSSSSRLRQHTLLPNSAAPSALSTHHHCSATERGFAVQSRRGLAGAAAFQTKDEILPSLDLHQSPLHQHRPCSGLVLSVKVPTPNVCTDGKERC